MGTSDTRARIFEQMRTDTQAFDEEVVAALPSDQARVIQAEAVRQLILLNANIEALTLEVQRIADD